MKALVAAIVILVGLFVLYHLFSPEPVVTRVTQVEFPDGTEPREEHRGSELKEPSLVTQFLIGWWWYILYYTIGAVFGIFVYRDARQLEKLALNIPPAWWGVLVIFEPPLGLLAYWVLNHSRFSAGEVSGNHRE